MHIQCTKGSHMVNTLEHLPLLPLSIDYHYSHRSAPTVPEQDEFGIYHKLRFHGRICHIELELPPSILHKVVVLLGEHFPKLEHLSLSFAGQSGSRLPLTLPKAFLAPNLRHLTLPSISPPRRLQLLTSTFSLVKLELSGIQTSSYFRPRLLVARLRSLPLLEELSIAFSIPIPRPSTEMELLGEKGTPITLPSLKTLWFDGVGAYLESLVAQIRVPLLEEFFITLFNQIAFVLPHLSHLINIKKVFKVSIATVSFNRDGVSVFMDHDQGPTMIPFLLHVSCKSLDWQLDCAAQICDALIPTLSGVEELSLEFDSLYPEIPTELRNGAIDSAMWHDLLRSFIGVKKLRINHMLLEELSRALQVDEVGSDPGFLPNLQSLHAYYYNLFSSFINTRQIVGRPVKWHQW